MLTQLSAEQRKWVRKQQKRYATDLTFERAFRATRARQESTVDKRTGLTGFEEHVANIESGFKCSRAESIAVAIGDMYRWNIETRGIVRRIVLNRPPELANALSLSVRLHRLFDCHPKEAKSDLCVNVWRILHGLAAGDFDVARGYLARTPKRLTSGNRSNVLIYNAINAIMTQNKRWKGMTLKECDRPNVPERDKAVLSCLSSIIQNDAESLADSLDWVLKSFRRTVYIHDYEKIISFTAHGIAELAFNESPELLDAFDTTRVLPWDAKYYKFLRRKNRSFAYLDLSGHSEMLDLWVRHLERPPWWDR